MNISWSYAACQSRQLGLRIKAAGYKPDIIVAITRGGLTPACILSHILDCKKIVSMCLEHYVAPEKTLKEVKKLLLFPFGTVMHKKVLIVDDVCDSGQTLLYAYRYCRNFRAEEVKTATLHYKPSSLDDGCRPPDFFVNETKGWIKYPWEYDE